MPQSREQRYAARAARVAAAVVVAPRRKSDVRIRALFSKMIQKNKEAARKNRREAWLDRINLPCFHMGVGKGVYKFCTKKPGETCKTSKSKYFPRRGRCVSK